MRSITGTECLGRTASQRATLKPLPVCPYQLACWTKTRVDIDDHVELRGHWYSVPFSLVGNPVEVRDSEGDVEVFLVGLRVAIHVRSAQMGALHHLTRAHARLPWALHRVDALAPQPLGRRRRPLVREAGGRTHDEAAPPAAALSLVAGRAAPD
ncbi:Mu transposase domain-containing protein [Myxococcus xanthus]|uniref:Mu transposase domain-containing protein n=1 Tax=Myxococcus xanthus TaxID=34 RepID=UPI003F51065D